MIVNQWIPAAHVGDAIGDHARRLRVLLRELGHESEIYALTIDDDLRDEVRPYADPGSKQGDITILHFAVVSPMTQAFKDLKKKCRSLTTIIVHGNDQPSTTITNYQPPTTTNHNR